MSLILGLGLGALAAISNPRRRSKRRNTSGEMKTDEQIPAKALVDHFGVTNDINEAGYILPDGRMLDFSGRHQTSDYTRVGNKWVAKGRDWMKGQRNVDHREIPNDITPAQGGEAINWMLERGAIRVDAGSGIIHTGVMPSGKQEPLVRQIIDMHDGEVGVDLNGDGFRDTGMDFRAPVRRFNQYYDRGTKAVKILGHMRRFFSGENLDTNNPPHHPVLPYAAAHRWEPLARAKGVSVVARSPRGFMRAYERAGSWAALDPYWKRRRAAFIARHMAQVRQNREKLWKRDRTGALRPSRRALALIMWAYKP